EWWPDLGKCHLLAQLRPGLLSLDRLWAAIRARPEDVNTATPDGRPLTIAVQKGCRGAAELLRKSGAVLTCAGADGLLRESAKGGNVEALQLLLFETSGCLRKEPWASLNARPVKHGGTPLDVAVSQNQQECVELLLKAGGRRSLHRAAELAMPSMVRAWLSEGAAVEECDSSGATPLLLAAKGRGRTAERTECLQLLLRAEAVVDALPITQVTPLMHAASRGVREHCELLLEARADCHCRDRNGRQPIDHAATEDVRALLSAAMSAGQGAECQREEECLWAEEDQATLPAPNPSNLPYAWHQLPQDWHQMTAGYHMLPHAQQAFPQQLGSLGASCYVIIPPPKLLRPSVAMKVRARKPVDSLECDVSTAVLRPAYQIVEPISSPPPVVQAARCPACGNVYMTDSVYCRKCGRKRDILSPDLSRPFSVTLPATLPTTAPPPPPPMPVRAGAPGSPVSAALPVEVSSPRAGASPPFVAASPTEGLPLQTPDVCHFLRADLNAVPALPQRTEEVRPGRGRGHSPMHSRGRCDNFMVTMPRQDPQRMTSPETSPIRHNLNDSAFHEGTSTTDPSALSFTGFTFLYHYNIFLTRGRVRQSRGVSAGTGSVCKLFVKRVGRGSLPPRDLPAACDRSHATLLTRGASTARQSASTGTGFLLDGRFVITNAHVVHRAVSVLVRATVGPPVKWNARVLAVGLPCDLAILAVEDEFWKGKESLTLSRDIPKLDDNVTCIGFPVGGENISVTRGVVSRIDVHHDGLLRVQIDAAINPGNSGGPVLGSHGKIVGVAASHLKHASNIGYIIPTQVLEQFISCAGLQGAERAAEGGEPSKGYLGVSSLGVGSVQTLESVPLRRMFGLPEASDIMQSLSGRDSSFASTMRSAGDSEDLD
ncbi:DEGP10, partial [Symbiodinium necroappetens]